jgi:septal ring factor EnvC (AmiA/AmiB activator)
LIDIALLFVLTFLWAAERRNMTNEQRDKTINFILEQQAKLTSDMQQIASNLQQLTEATAASEKRISRLEGAIVTVVNMIGESNKRTDAKIAEANAKWAETRERLDHFIFVLEKYISERKNGTN